MTGEKPNNVIHGIHPKNKKFALYYFDMVGYLENKAQNELLNILEGDY